MPGKILVIDEKPFMLRLIQHHLERAGYELIKARNQREAIVAMAQQSPDLVVTDDGGSLPQSPLKSFGKKSTQKIPVIRMTDVPQDPEKEVTDKEVILTKPFSPTQLVAEVKRLVNDV